jgi:hypothetical protein
LIFPLGEAGKIVIVIFPSSEPLLCLKNLRKNGDFSGRDSDSQQLCHFPNLRVLAFTLACDTLNPMISPASCSTQLALFLQLPGFSDEEHKQYVRPRSYGTAAIFKE